MLPWSLKTTIEPTEEPVSVAEMRDHLRVDIPDEDTETLDAIRAARLHAETFTRRRLCTATCQLLLEGFPGTVKCHLFDNDRILIPTPPLGSVTSITYIDSDGTTQTLATAAYTVVTGYEPGIVHPSWGYVWPTTRVQPGAVTITFTCGYGAASAVPAGIKRAIKMMAANLYEHRGEEEAELPMAVTSLLMQHRYMGVA